ncbi:cation:proton antiporter [uncultured Fretibacterium sp.]|uniref:cation:proton antiporter n=1 Tax=uncultured Fretibacterium sp. TaxID=1678694 RepID=UPI0026253B42|nr:cation:proton antiporter [uncultured Fretibacterium sp.]
MPNYISAFRNTSSAAAVIISVALMLFSGFMATRLTKRLRLPDVTAYIVSGILIGPYCLHLVPPKIIDGTDFLPDIALAFIAFGTGEFFRMSILRKNGLKVVIITILEACLTSLLIFAVVYYVLRLNFAFSVVLGALASATAPASTMMTIRQTGAKGDFVNTLLQVVALDDVVGLIEYSIAISVALASISGPGTGSGVGFDLQFDLRNVLLPIAVNAGVLALGCFFGLAMKWMLFKKHSTDNRLIIAIALLFSFCGICTLFDVSPLLGCMSMGTVYVNLTEDDKLFKQLNYFSPPILLLFFVRSGLSFELDALFSTSAVVGSAPLLLVGAVYFIVRILGKYAGAFWGCLLVHKPKNVRNYLGLALIPQAGVAIGLAALGARTLGGEMGGALQTIILASSVLYELIGPGCAKLSLYLSGSYHTRLEDIVPEEDLPASEGRRSAIELLIERIQKIQKELPPPNPLLSEEEDAFMEASEKQYAAMEASRRYANIRRSRLRRF